MTRKNNIEEKELQEAAPTLSGLDRKDPFIAPESYFDDLPERVKQRKVKVIRMSTARLAIPLAAAAVVAMTGIYIGFFKQRLNDTVQQPRYASAPLPQTEQIIDELVDGDISEDLIVEALSEGDLALDDELFSDQEVVTNTAADTSAVSEEPMDAVDKEIIAYLIDYDIDIETIIEQL